MCQKINRLAQEIINCILYLIWPWYLSRNDSVCWCYSFLCVITTKRNGKFRHSWNDTFNFHLFLLHLITINHIFSRVTADRSTTHQGRDQTEMCLISGSYTRPVVKSKVNRFETSQNSSLHVNLHLIFPAGHRYSLCWTKKKGQETFSRLSYLNLKPSKSDWLLIYPYSILTQILRITVKVNDSQFKKPLVVKQIFLVITIRNETRKVWRIWLLMLEFNPLTPKISLVILPSVCQVILIMLVWRIWYRVN